MFNDYIMVYIVRAAVSRFIELRCTLRYSFNGLNQECDIFLILIEYDDCLASHNIGNYIILRKLLMSSLTTQSKPSLKNLFTAESYETSGEYCQDEIFNATCSYDSVINVTYAQFGRTEVGRCIQQNLYLGCMKDVTLYLNSMCLGKRSCHVSIMDSALRSHKPCPVDVTWHLKATYKCVHGIYYYLMP